jgi:glycosyltransferase involved in cell wall biosynthesis
MFDGKPITHSAVFKGKVKTYNSVFNKIDKILVPTEFSKNIFDWLGGTKAEVLPLYYDENIFKSIPELKSYQTQPFVFLSVSRNTTRKNLGNLLVGFKQFLDQGYNAHLRLRTELEVHDSTSFNLQGLAHSLRLGKHITADRFHPAIGHRQADLVMSYNTSDCGIYASTREGFCMPALESMACGIPVVITEKTAMDSWVPEEMTRVHSSATFVNALASTEEVIATPDDIELAMTVAYNRYYGKTNHREEIRKAVEPMRLSLFLKRLDKILQEL